MKTYSQAELFPLPVQMFDLLLEHHHVLGEDAVSQLHLHGLQLLHLVGPVCQRLLQLLHGNAPRTSLGTKLLWFPNLLLNPCLGCGGGEEGNVQQLVQSLLAGLD